jgi:hypothetical protein
VALSQAPAVGKGRRGRNGACAHSVSTSVRFTHLHWSQSESTVRALVSTPGMRRAWPMRAGMNACVALCSPYLRSLHHPHTHQSLQSLQSCKMD